MNAKKVKIVRNHIRMLGHDERRAEYKTEKGRLEMVKTGRLMPNGQPEYGVTEITGTITLDPNCGRAQYQTLKRMV